MASPASYTAGDNGHNTTSYTYFH